MAGPISNIILGFLAAFIFVLYVMYVPKDFSLFDALAHMLRNLIVINFSLAIFNLIPLPPLDGANALQSFMGYEALRKFQVVQAYSFYILIFLMITGILNIIQYPILFLDNMAISLATHILGFATGL